MKIIIISAVAQNGVIGRSNGEMPWHVKEEFKHFKDTTQGYPIIMGRVTFETLGKPLKNRLNVIISSRPDYSVPFDEVKIYRSLTDAVESVTNLNPEKIFIIGGGEVYRQSISFADEMIISIMHFDAEGDIYFPKIDSKVWKEISRDKREQFDIITYVRK
ncbi:MAG TPA: dihydrofolate reductase [Ignavibacteriaceae bacterium]|nr:dihydrofolate reductase [Ignavibacteriaceae bacterium]